MAAAGLALSLAACSPALEQAPPAQPTINGSFIVFPGQKDPADLRLAEVQAATDRPITLTGRMTWDEDRTVRVYAPYGGRVERLTAQLGERVNAGQTLAQISSPDVGQAQADWAKAQADWRVAQRQWERSQALLEAGVVSRKEAEQAQADHQRTKAEWERSRARLAQVGLNPEQGAVVHQSMGLQSPLAGVVVERNANPGAEVRPDVQGAPLFVVSDPSHLWVWLDVDETLMSRLEPGATIQLSTAAWPDETFAATVMHVSEMVDPASRTVKVKARVPNPKRHLKAEMYVTAQVDNHHGYPLVPTDAVFVRGQEQMVFVSLGEGRYERRKVSVRMAGPQVWHVLEGLKPKDKVVLGGALFLNQLMDAAQ